MKIADVLKKIRRIELRTKGLSSQVFSGAYKTRFKGRGMSFSEVRQYQYGDDIRNIDWNVTARTNEPHVKVFEEERELTFMLLIDVSSSSNVGTVQPKIDLAVELAATLAFSAQANNDKVGALFFSDQIVQYFPPQKGKTAILKLLKCMLQKPTATQKTNLAVPLKYLTNILQKRCTAFLISDFIAEDYTAALKLAAFKHDLIALHLVAPTDYELPQVGMMPFMSAETGQVRWLDSQQEATKKAYRLQFEEHQQRTKKLFVHSGADFLTMHTEQPFVQELIQFFKNRAML